MKYKGVPKEEDEKEVYLNKRKYLSYFAYSVFARKIGKHL